MKSEINAENENEIKRAGLYRLSRIFFCIIIILLSLFLVWPGYALFSSPTPLILGFPLSFAWVIFGTIIGFISLYTLYRMDNKREKLR